MNKLLSALALGTLLLVFGCKEDCETNDTGALLVSNPDNGWNPDSIQVYMGLSNLGTVRLNGEKLFNKLPAGKREITFKYQSDTLYSDSVTIISCSTTLYAINFLPVSDKRLKQNIQPLNPVLASLLNLRTYSFEYDRQAHPNYTLPAGTHYGFMAQELNTYFPEAVRPYRDGYYAVDYQSMVPVLTRAIQEQQAEIDDLKAELANLKNALQQQTASN